MPVALLRQSQLARCHCYRGQCVPCAYWPERHGEICSLEFICKSDRKLATFFYFGGSERSLAFSRGCVAFMHVSLPMRALCGRRHRNRSTLVTRRASGRVFNPTFDSSA